MALTPEQIEKLNKAINAARNPGGCKYADNHGACCVIGQLMAIEGLPLPSFAPSNYVDGNKMPISSSSYKSAIHLRERYPTSLLITVQDTWDTTPLDAVSDRVEEAREAMRQEVISYAALKEHGV